MARRKPTGISPQNMILFICAAALVGFFVGRATAPETTAADATAGEVITQADMVLAPGDTGKKLAALASPSKGPVDAPVVIHEVSEFQ